MQDNPRNPLILAGKPKFQALRYPGQSMDKIRKTHLMEKNLILASNFWLKKIPVGIEAE